MPGLGRDAAGPDQGQSRFASMPAGLRGKRPIRRSGKKLPTFCVFCKNNNENEGVYTSHVLKDQEGRVVCPALYIYKCPICQNTGHEAHTVKHCPYNPDLLRKQTQLAEIWRSYRESNPLEGSSQHNVRQGMMEAAGACLGIRGGRDGASSGLKGASFGHSEGGSLGINMMGTSSQSPARERFSAVGGRVGLSGPPSPPLTDATAWAPWSPGSQTSSLGSSWTPSSAWTPPSSPPLPSLLSPASPPTSPSQDGENHLMENLIKLLHINN